MLINAYKPLLKLINAHRSKVNLYYKPPYVFENVLPNNDHTACTSRLKINRPGFDLWLIANAQK